MAVILSDCDYVGICFGSNQRYSYDNDNCLRTRSRYGEGAVACWRVLWSLDTVVVDVTVNEEGIVYGEGLSVWSGSSIELFFFVWLTVKGFFLSYSSAVLCTSKANPQ